MCRGAVGVLSAKSLSLPLLPSDDAKERTERTSQVRALHADTLVVEACQAEAPEALSGRARLLRNVFAALVACFMGATDGLNHDYQALGMSIGLLTTLVANAGSLMGSEIKFGIPTVIILAEYFKTLGPAKCATIYTMVLLFIFSSLIFVSGDYVVAVLPKLLPGSVLVYVILGTAPMMLFGFISVAGIVQAQLATIPVIGGRQSLSKLRSPRLHTTCDRESVANELGCCLILTRPDPSVLLQMQNFGLPLLDLRNQALEMVEDAFLAKYQPAPGHCRGHTHFGLRSTLSSSGLNLNSALFGVFLDFHAPLHQELCDDQILQVENFQVDHIWNPNCETEQSVRALQDMHRAPAAFRHLLAPRAPRRASRPATSATSATVPSWL
eukprot:Skav215815  [mRNA]  locus=scaffold3449:51768:62661:- [translate_table: standard]